MSHTSHFGATRSRGDDSATHIGNTDAAWDPQYIRGCAGKIRYSSKRLAKVAARAMHARGAHQTRFGPYKCRPCGKWHVGKH